MASYADSDRSLTVQGLITDPDTLTQAITSTHISSFNINEDAGRDVPIGAAPASQFLLKLDNSSGQWEPGGSLLGAHSLDGAKIEIEIGLWNGSAYDYSKIGTYYVEDVRGQEHETTITLSGSDAMIPKMSAYFADAPGDYPRTIGALLVDVAAEAGVTLESSTFTNSNVSITAQPNWRNDLTCRDVVGYIAACAGGIAKFNRDGKLDITTLERAASRAISTSVYKRLTRENTTFGALNAINIYAHGAPENTAPVRFATTPATPDTSLNSINIKGNPILANGSSTTSSVGTGMLTALSGMSFRGATFDWHGDPSLVLGKICSVTDLSSNSISVLITKQTIKFDAGFEMTSGCDVTTSTKADASNKLQKIFTPTGNLNAEALAGNIYVKAGEKMTLESGSNLNLLSGGAINIKNLGDAANIINMDNTGLTLSSTGQLKLQSTDSIIIGGSPFSVGGTNLIKNAAFRDGLTHWTVQGDGEASTSSGYPLGTDTSIRLLTEAGQTSVIVRQEIPNLPLYSEPRPYTLSFEYSVHAHHIANFNDLSPVIVYFWDASDQHIGSLGFPVSKLVGNLSATMEQFHRAENTFMIPAGAVKAEVLLRVFGNPSSGTLVYYGRIKLEEGTIATDWSPSPQDTADALDALDGRLGDVETRVQVFYQASKPTYTAVGDLWYDTDSNPLEIWKCTNVSTQAHSAFTDPVLTRALAAQTTANSKINTFVGSNTPTALAAGDLWMDTGNKNIWKRATAAGTGGWVQYLTAAGYLITTGITIDGTDLTVKATGNLNLAADGNLNVQNGGNLNVLNGGDIEINNGGDITVASGGKINVSATDLMISGKTVETYASDSIKLAVSDFQSGGGNLLDNSHFDLNESVGWQSPYSTFTVFNSVLRATFNQVHESARVERKVTIPTPGTYTYTIFAAMPINVEWRGFEGATVESFSDASASASYKVYSVVFKVTAPGEVLIRAYQSNAPIGSVCYVEWEMLQFGNIPGTWSPSLLDSTRYERNQLVDSHFETGGANGWSTNYGPIVVSDSLLTQTIATSASASRIEKIFTIPKGGVYTFTISAKTQWDLIWQAFVNATIISQTNGAASSSVFKQYSVTFYTPADNQTVTLRAYMPNVPVGRTVIIDWEKLQLGSVATDWSEHYKDPASGVKTSYIDIATDHIDIATGGNLSLTGGNFNLTGGSDTKAIGMSTNRADEYMMWAGDATPSAAPFSVKRDGSVKATSGVIGGFTLGTSKLYNGKSTLTSTTAGVYVGTDGISLGSAGVAPQFKVTSAGSLYSSSGTIGGFTIASGSLSAQASGKPLLKLDTANSKFELGDLIIDYGWDVGGVLHPRLYATLATKIEIPQVLFSTGSGMALVNIGTGGLSIYDGGAYIEGTVDADDYLYHTPAFTGEATSLISKIKDDGKGNIDHSTMPIFARRNVKSIKKDKDGKSILSVADGASLVAMISILTKAVQELDGRLEKIEDRIK